MKKTKYFLIFILLLLVFFVLEVNLEDRFSILPLQVLIFALVVGSLILWPFLKLIFVYLANILFLIMVIFFILDLVAVANVFGSLGFGIFLITVLFYLPQLIKYGHIERI